MFVNNQMLRFVGEDGSMGLKHGKVYNISVYIYDKYIWVCWSLPPFLIQASCPYMSTKQFAANWRLPWEEFDKKQTMIGESQ